MPKTPKPKSARPVDVFTHADNRRNIPTAEFQDIAQRMEEVAPIAPAHYPRATPLAQGDTRARNADLDPQIIWRGMRIRLTQEQREQLQQTGTVELGDAQLVWRGKDTQDWSDLIVNPPPIYIQEKVHPKAIIDGLQKDARARAQAAEPAPDLFADFNGLNDPEARLEFYQHDQHWSNRMILGDSLQVMASLAEREGLRGKVQCIYFDPPYGIKFNSNWQVSTQSRDVKDGKREDMSREPEQVKAFRDTWKDGIHSYLTYLRDRLTVARELLTESGSIFVQIGDENVHRVRALMDEVFGSNCYVSEIKFQKTGSSTSSNIQNFFDTIIWYSRSLSSVKSRRITVERDLGDLRNDITPWLAQSEFSYLKLTRSELATSLNRNGLRVFTPGPLNSQHFSPTRTVSISFEGEAFAPPGNRQWTYDPKVELIRLARADYLLKYGNTLRVKMFRSDNEQVTVSNLWTDTQLGGVSSSRVYVVQTADKVIQRCILMATDPGDLVLDPTCGSGTTATVAEQWGRRWITIDTSRVALALARTRLMAARYPYYLLADSTAGRAKEASLTGKPGPDSPAHNDLRHGFVYERAPHVTLKSIANNAEIDVIWESAQATLEPLRAKLNAALGRGGATPAFGHCEEPLGDEAIHAATHAAGGADGLLRREEAARNDEGRGGAPRNDEGRQEAPRNDEGREGAPRDDGVGGRGVAGWEEWEIPRAAEAGWPEAARRAHAAWWEARIERQRKIDASIARRADIEYLYDRPYEDKSRVRVAGPFTVESLSPHRVVPADEDELLDLPSAPGKRRAATAPPADFATMVLDHLRSAGVHQHSKGDSIRFTALQGWEGVYIGAEGRFMEGDSERRAAILIGPEFGTLSRPDLVTAAREASEARFDVLIACAFNYDAHASELTKLGPLPILKARMNPDLHMADDLKNTGKGNMFVVFGEPDVVVEPVAGAPDQVRIRIRGVDVFDPQTGDIRSGDTKSIAAWFIDTDYNEESFYVRHAYFLGAQDPYKSLKTALRAEIDEDAWATLYREVSRPFARPETGRIAVKVINHFGDEVMKVFTV